MSRKQCNDSHEQIQILLSKYVAEANQWAHFSQRETVLNAERFVTILVLGWLRQPAASLNELAYAAAELGCRITAAALHERMNGEAVMLLASVWSLAMQGLHQQCPLPLPALRQFTSLYVTDSTQIALPPALAPIFVGNRNNSMVKLQVVWDYLNGNLAAVELTDGRQPDQRCPLPVQLARAGSLQVFDLGYFKQEYLRDIAAQAAFFVCRYQSQTGLYSLHEQMPFDLCQWLRTLSGTEGDIHLLLGERVKLPVRLVVRRLPAAVADARRRKAKAKAKKQGQSCSASYRFLLGWDLLLTNLPPQSWSGARLFDLYAIRWQIEWLFRVWKDRLGVAKFGPWRVERVLCQLYAHLLAALLCHVLTAPCRWRNAELSFHKAVQIIQSQIPSLMHCLARRRWGCRAWLRRLEAAFQHFGWKSKRRKTPSTTQIVYNWGLS